MAIKQQHTLSKEDFEAALVTLRLSVSEVARDTEIPRHVVSHFRNYGDGMKPEQVAKLRDYLEDKGIEFTEEEAAEELAATAPTEPQTSDSAQIFAGKYSAWLLVSACDTRRGRMQKALHTRHVLPKPKITY